MECRKINVKTTFTYLKKRSRINCIYNIINFIKFRDDISTIILISNVREWAVYIDILYQISLWTFYLYFSISSKITRDSQVTFTNINRYKCVGMYTYIINI